MFNNLKIYNVYTRQDEEEPLETALFVHDGFSLWAFVFHTFWALYHKVWHLAILCIILFGSLFYAQMNIYLNPVIFAIIGIGLRLWVGYEANKWYTRSLEKRGYILFDIVAGRNKEEAELRFFDHNISSSRSDSLI